MQRPDYESPQVRENAKQRFIDELARLQDLLIEGRAVFERASSETRLPPYAGMPLHAGFVVGITAITSAFALVRNIAAPSLPIDLIVRPYYEIAGQLLWASWHPDGFARYLVYWNKANAKWAEKGKKHLGDEPDISAVFDNMPQALNTPAGLAQMPDDLPTLIRQVEMQARPNLSQHEVEKLARRQYELVFPQLHSVTHVHPGVWIGFSTPEASYEVLGETKDILFATPTYWLLQAVCRVCDVPLADLAGRVWSENETIIQADKGNPPEVPGTGGCMGV